MLYHVRRIQSSHRNPTTFLILLSPFILKNKYYMREIKFRAWDGKKMIQSDVVTFMVEFDGTIWENISRYEGDNLKERTNLYLMQYTGLKDKNGKEIYEGDIVEKFRSRDMSGNDVEYWKESVEFETGKETSGFYISFLESCEIIGNIYEHPHLLNSEQGVQESDTTGLNQGTKS